ncbi:MAG TPA: SDR family oxidoreductase [Cytophagales bacterium]|nr:SDR family oxidoreductase [Cytophagales bacterium]
MLRLKGKVAIVTGGATGIGEAICKKFAREGATVIVNGMPGDPVKEVVENILQMGGQAYGYSEDISEAKYAKECVKLTIKKCGKLDILINNAGVFPIMKQTHDFADEAFYYMLRNNVVSMYMMTKYALPELQKTRGCIVAAGSESGTLGLPFNTTYGGTKGFIHAFIKGVAVEQAKYGVRANIVAPGPIDTAWTHDETGPMSVKQEKMFISATPLGRRGTPEEVANVYLFLASDEASYVTGGLYEVDGGITLSKGPVGLEVPGKLAKEPESTLDLEHTMEGATSLE